MMRLIFFDLKDHASTWLGAGLVAVGCGFVGGWVASVMTTAHYYTGSMQQSLQSMASMLITFSLIAALAVLISTSNLTVSVQRRSYALWQMVNMNPRLITLVVLVQLVVVSLLGGIVGSLIAFVGYAPLFPLIMSTLEGFSEIVPRTALSALPAVWLIVAALFFLGGLKGARKAGKTPPLTALREPEPRQMSITWVRIALFLGMLALTVWIVWTVAQLSADEVMTWSLFFPALILAIIVPLAPLVFALLLRAWTAIIPQKRWNAWYLARHTARYGLGVSTSVQTPLMVSFGLTGGLFSLLNLMAYYAQLQGQTDPSDYTLGFSQTIIMLGAPVLLCAIGAAVSVIMSSGSRSRDVALLLAGGAQPTTLLGAALCEAFIHAVNATLVGMISVVISNGITAFVLGLPLLAGLNFSQALIISAVGFALVLAATLIPTCTALNKETAAVLSVRE